MAKANHRPSDHWRTRDRPHPRARLGGGRPLVSDRRHRGGHDGTIELRDGPTPAVTNQVVQVQSRAASGRFTAETDHSFEHLWDERDLDYWLGGNALAILVRSRPEEDEAYWVPLKKSFADPERKSGCVQLHGIDYSDRHAAAAPFDYAGP
jgi:hypothetical protein